MEDGVEDRVVEALHRRGAIFMCVHEGGTRAFADPGALTAHSEQFFCPEVPVEVFQSDTADLVITSFFTARSAGYSSAIVKTADGVDARVEFYDDRPRSPGIVAVLSPADGDTAPDASPAIELPVRLIVGRIDGSGATVEISASVTKLLGWSDTEYFALSLEEKVHPEDIPRVVESFVELLGRPGGQTRIRQRFRHRDGSWRWFEITQTNLLDTEDPHIRAESLDISAELEVQLALQEREALLGRLNEAMPVGILHLKHDGEVALANAMWQTICRCAPGDEFSSLLSSIGETAAVQMALDTCRLEGDDLDMSITFPSVDGEDIRHGELRVRPLRHDDAPFGLLVTLTDVTQSVVAQETLWSLARHDHLTQVRNRLGVEEAITKLLSEQTTDSPSLTVAYFDIDDFKSINDRCGHSVGDEVLAATADQMRRQLRPTDLIGRLGGDEFLVVLAGATRAEARSVVSRIEQQLITAGSMLSENVKITASIGIATAETGDTFDSLVRRADQAMYSDKTNKKIAGSLSEEAPRRAILDT